MPKASKPTPSGAKVDALDRKWRRTTTYEMPIADPAPAQERVRASALALRLAKATPADREDQAEVVAAAEAEHQAAQDALAACYSPIVFQAASARTFQQLLSDHPPVSDEAKRRGDHWNPDTFQPALIAACCRDLSLTAEEWQERFEDDSWSLADRNAIFAVALAANVGA